MLQQFICLEDPKVDISCSHVMRDAGQAARMAITTLRGASTVWMLERPGVDSSSCLVTMKIVVAMQAARLTNMTTPIGAFIVLTLGRPGVESSDNS